MQFLFLCLIFSLFSTILLKYFKIINVNLEQAILFNYMIAIILTFFILKPEIPNNLSSFKNYNLYIYISLGILLPSIFILQGKAIQIIGLAKTDTVQRLSLIIPIIIAYTVYREEIIIHKLIAIFLCIIAVILIIHQPKKNKSISGFTEFLLLISVWVGLGIIDVLFKQLATLGAKFTTNLFFIFVLSFIFMLIYIIFIKQKVYFKNIISGLILGVSNFFNILFYIKAHQYYKTSPSIVFVSIGVGIIILATLTGVIFFKEKIFRLNYIGIILAIASICLLLY